LTLLLAATSLSACGDLGNVNIKLTFPDQATESATRRLKLIARELPVNSDGCDALWGTPQPGLKERQAFVDFPNRNDILAENVKLTDYPALDMLVYAYPSLDTTTSQPIAGGCQGVKTNTGSDEDITVTLKKPN
jgi:hypothetical protein